MFKKFFRDHKVHKKVVPYFDGIFFLSPMNYYFSWLMICIGIYLNLYLSNLPTQFLSSFNSIFLLLFIGNSLVLSSLYIQSEIIKKDNKNKIFNFIEQKYSLSKIILFVKFLSVLSIVVLLLVSILNALIGVLLLLLKNFSGNLSKNKLIYYFTESTLLFYSGWFCTNYYYTNRGIILIDLIFIIPYFLVCYCIYISKKKLDSYIVNNSQTNKYDFKVLKSVILLLFCLFIGIKNSDPLISIVSITSIGFFLYSFIRSEERDIIRAFIYPLALFNIFLMTIFPYLFVFHFSLFYISKYYYWHRFNIHYPTFLVDNK